MAGFLLGMSGSCLVTAQLVVYRFTGSSGNEESFGADAQPENGAASDMSRGSGVAGSRAAGTFSARSWSGGGFDADDYFNFSIAPAPGFVLALTGLELDERRSGAGIRDWSVRSSLDGFAADLPPSPFNVPDDDETRRDRRLALGGSRFSGLTESVEFRIYGYNAESGSGTWRIDNVELFGQITAVPEPAAAFWGAAGVLACAGFAVVRRFRVFPV